MQSPELVQIRSFDAVKAQCGDCAHWSRQQPTHIPEFQLQSTIPEDAVSYDNIYYYTLQS